MVAAPVLTIVPTKALPPWMLSTNQVSVALPPDIVAVNSCDWEVVTAVRCGERETVMVLGAGGVGVGVGEVKKVPPPQEVSPGNKSAETKTRAKIERFVRKKDELLFRSIASITMFPVQISNRVGAPKATIIQYDFTKGRKLIDDVARG